MLWIFTGVFHKISIPMSVCIFERGWEYVLLWFVVLIQVFYNYFVLIRLRKTYGLIASGPDNIGCFEEVGKEENSVCSKAFFAFDKYQGSAYNLKLSQNEICR